MLDASSGHTAFPGTNGSIVFVTSQDSYTGLVLGLRLVNPDGSGLKVLTRSATDALPAWSPNGKLIAYAGGDAPCKFGLYTVRADGSQPKELPEPFTWYVDRPAWSPDGTRIAVPGAPCPGVGAQIYILDLAKGKFRPLGVNHSRSEAIFDESPAWSPDGVWICFSRAVRESAPHLYLIRANGTGLRKLSNMPGENPSWSPDGASIAFDNGKNVLSIGADGTGLRRLTLATVAEVDPAWSPDGAAIVYARARSLRRNTVFDLWMMNADGSGQTLLSRNGTEPDWQSLPGG